jgi:hypothetical protein
MLADRGAVVAFPVAVHRDLAAVLLAEPPATM